MTEEKPNIGVVEHIPKEEHKEDKNKGKENGSGLGLYIVKYIAEQSGGSIELINHKNGEKGFEAVVSFPVKNYKKDFS